MGMDGFEGKESPSSLARFELRIVQPVASLYTCFQQESAIVQYTHFGRKSNVQT